MFLWPHYQKLSRVVESIILDNYKQILKNIIYLNYHNIKVSTQHAAQMTVLKEAGLSIKQIIQKFDGTYSRATVYWYAGKKLGQSPTQDRRRNNRGRGKVLSSRDERSILRAIPRQREKVGRFTSPRLAMEAGVSGRVSNRTVRRCMNKAGFGYFVSGKKGPR